MLYYLSAVIIVARHHIKSMLYVVNYVYPSYQGYHQNMDDQGVELVCVASSPKTLGGSGQWFQAPAIDICNI